MKKLRLKRHGSFSIREGWFEKAINSINESEIPVFSKGNGVAILGIGANMVTSLRYWLIASKIIKEKSNDFTNFGELILKFDRYLDSNFSWWMIHQNLVSNFKDAPIFNIVFNYFNLKNFKKETMDQFIIHFMKDNEYDLSNLTQVDADVTVFLRTYINEKITNPEDNLCSPLGKLGLLRKSSGNLYNFTQPSHDVLPYQVVYYSLLNCLDEEEKKHGINIDDLISKYNSPAKIFKLDKNLFYLYLNEMKQSGLVMINRTAGLNMLYIQKMMNEKEIFEDFFMEAE